MKKITNRIILIIFCLFIAITMILTLALPKKEYSEFENRYLQKTPTLSFANLKSGKLTSDIEKYFSDHIVLRDKWVGLNSLYQFITGKGENGGVFYADNSLIKKSSSITDEAMEKKAGYINRLCENVDVPVYFGIIPSSASIWDYKLKSNTYTSDEKEIIEKAYSLSDAKSVDLYSALEENKSEDIYYRTDHHWTSLGAYYGANAIFSAMEIESINISDYQKTTVCEDFSGTSRSSSGAFWVKNDSIDIYIPESGIEVTSYSGTIASEGKLYNYDKLDIKDKYTFFLGGNKPLCIIKSDNSDSDKKVLIIRDSYTDSLAPFLTERFAEIHLFDLRYSKMSIKDYVKENNIDTVLVLYSFDEFCDDTNFVMMIK